MLSYEPVQGLHILSRRRRRKKPVIVKHSGGIAAYTVQKEEIQ